MEKWKRAYIAATDAGVFDLNNDIVWRFELRYWTVLKFDIIGGFEHEGEVLLLDLLAIAICVVPDMFAMLDAG